MDIFGHLSYAPTESGRTSNNFPSKILVEPFFDMDPVVGFGGYLVQCVIVLRIHCVGRAAGEKRKEIES